ncbi:probable G-protein coupled receptor Mth-like 11 [Rhipicephalus sanguineus]|uniref:probable G-protein coupled receptor Mth-like 11 n=1 Tax=Rhipicephalus sanguineus TaxID=34632 RepID=UPI0018955603|nr:probable G-protein coupled receptor Mth-like 11 [Rhipicephalus sanguineus]
MAATTTLRDSVARHAATMAALTIVVVHFLLVFVVLGCPTVQAHIAAGEPWTPSITPELLLADRVAVGLDGPNCTDRCSALDKPRMCKCRSREECSQTGDCCADRFIGEVPRPRIACVPAVSYRELTAVVRCPETWTPADERDNETKARCESANPRRFNLTYLDDLPVLSRLTWTLYRNVYCASCNGDTRDLRSWTLVVQCTPNEVSEALQNGTATVTGYSWQMRKMTVRRQGVPDESPSCTVAIKELLNKTDEHIIRDLKVTPCRQISLVKTCPNSYNNAEVIHKCRSYTSVLEDRANLRMYKNLHCAICNKRNPKKLSCTFEAQLAPPLRDYSGASYAVVMDFSNWQASVLSAAPTKNVCGRDEIHEPLSNRCVRSACPADVCVRRDDCQWTRLRREQVVVRDDSTLLPNPDSEEELNPDRWHMDGPDTVMACMSLAQAGSNAALRPQGFENVLSTVLLLLSVLCLVLHVAAYALVPKLRTGPSRLVLCLAISVLLAQGSFVAGGMFLDSGSVLCSAFAVVSHGAHLAAFFWMNVMAMDVQRTFRKGMSGSSRATSRFWSYSVYAWLAPAILVAAASTLQYLKPESAWSPSYGLPYCWINRPLSLIAFFGAPVLVLLLANTTFFLLTARSIHLTTKQTKVARRSASTGEASGEQGRLALYVKLAVVFGLTWVFGFAAALTGVQALWYPFIVLCCLQGAFIFLAFTFKRSVLRMVRDRLCGSEFDRRRRPRSTSTTLTALHSTLSASSSALASVATGRAMPAQTASPKGVQKPLLRRT